MFLLLIAACESSSNNAQKESTEDVKQIFKRTEDVELPTADISLATDAVSLTALYNTYEGMYRLGESDELIPAGAISLPEISDNGLKYTIKLNEKSKWSDGEPVTAQNYVFSWQRTVNPMTSSEYAEWFKPVKNAEKIIEGKLGKEELGIRALSDYDLEIELEAATPYFQQLLAFPNFFPQREDIVEEYGKDYATTSESAVYNGAFVLEGYTGPGISFSWKYIKNNEYWDKEAVKLDEVNIKVVKEVTTALNMYEDGKINETYLSGDSAQQNIDNPDFFSILQPNTFYAQYNMKKGNSIFKNENVRKAISYAIDRKSIVDKILANGSVIAETYVPVGLAYSPKGHEDFTKASNEKAEFDKGKAKELWKKAKKELGKDSVELELLVSDTESAKKVSEYLQGELQEILTGLQIEISPVPFSIFLDRRTAGDYDISLGGMGADYPDPMNYLNNLESDSPLNYSAYTNEKYDRLVEEINKQDGTNLELRWDKIIEANQIIMDELPITPIYQQAKTFLRNPTVKGIKSHSMGATFDYKTAEITK